MIRKRLKMRKIEDGMMDGKKNWKNSALRGFLALLLVMLLFTGISRAASSFTVIRVDTESPSSRKIEHIVTAEGTVEKNRELAVLTQPELLVQTIYVSEGETVKEGDLLAQLELESIEERIESLKNDIQVLKLQNEAVDSNMAKEQQTRNTEQRRAQEDYDRTMQEQGQQVAAAEEQLRRAQEALAAFDQQQAAATQQPQSDAVPQADAIPQADAVPKTDATPQTDAVPQADAIPPAESAAQGEPEPGAAAKDSASGENSGGSKTEGEGNDTDQEGKGNETEDGSGLGTGKDNSDESEGDSNGGSEGDSSSGSEGDDNDGSKGDSNGGSEGDSSPGTGEEGGPGDGAGSSTGTGANSGSGASNGSQSPEQIAAARKALEDAVYTANQEYAQALSAQDKARIEAARRIEDAKMSGATDTTTKINGLSIEEKEKLIKKLEQLKESSGTVLAPVDGVITKIDLVTGQRTTDTVAFTMADITSGMRYTAQIKEEDAKYLASGDLVSLKTAGKALQDLPVLTMEPDGENGLVTVTVLLEQDTLSIGDSATLEAVKQSEAYPLTLPISALRSENEKYYVLVLEEEESVLGKQLVARRVDVTVTEQNAAYVAVNSELLSENSQVITGSDGYIQAGDQVRLRES